MSANVPFEMVQFLSRARRLAAMSLAGFAMTACNPQEEASDRFKASGELVALSGGDAGAGGACHVCHGMKGEGDGNLAPRLAGLDQGYLLRQLDYFANGQRQHPQMSWIARRLQNDDRLRVADYYASMDAPKTAESPDTPSCSPAARDLYQKGAPRRGLAACANCHGKDGEGYGPGNPALAGQPSAYIVEQLRQWRSGERYGDPLGVMRRAALALSQQEIRELGAYVAEVDNSRFQAKCP